MVVYRDAVRHERETAKVKRIIKKLRPCKPVTLCRDGRFGLQRCFMQLRGIIESRVLEPARFGTTPALTPEVLKKAGSGSNIAL